MTRPPRPAPSVQDPGRDHRGPLMTLRDLADETRVSVRTLQREIGHGRLACILIGRQIRFRREQVDAWLSNGRG